MQPVQGNMRGNGIIPVVTPVGALKDSVCRQWCAVTARLIISAKSTASEEDAYLVDKLIQYIALRLYPVFIQVEETFSINDVMDLANHGCDEVKKAAFGTKWEKHFAHPDIRSMIYDLMLRNMTSVQTILGD